MLSPLQSYAMERNSNGLQDRGIPAANIQAAPPMLTEPNPYPTDVRTLSDEDLATLSMELEEAYRHWGGDDEYWSDDHAEKRYYEMRAEIKRRWEDRNPEEAEQQ